MLKLYRLSVFCLSLYIFVYLSLSKDIHLLIGRLCWGFNAKKKNLKNYGNDKDNTDEHFAQSDKNILTQGHVNQGGGTGR